METVQQPGTVQFLCVCLFLKQDGFLMTVNIDQFNASCWTQIIMSFYKKITEPKYLNFLYV